MYLQQTSFCLLLSWDWDKWKLVFIFRIRLGREGTGGQPGFAFLLLLTVMLPGRRGSSLLHSGLCRLMAASAVIQAIREVNALPKAMQAWPGRMGAESQVSFGP